MIGSYPESDADKSKISRIKESTSYSNNDENSSQELPKQFLSKSNPPKTRFQRSVHFYALLNLVDNNTIPVALNFSEIL